MKLFSKLLKYNLVTICFLTANVFADGPGATAFFDPLLQNGIQGFQTTCYNSINNQFLLTWLNNLSQATCSIYNTSGAQIGSQKILGSSASAVFSCYNNKHNQYFVTWVGNPSFAILDALSGFTIISATFLVSHFYHSFLEKINKNNHEFKVKSMKRNLE